jgi:hypothetical protein
MHIFQLLGSGLRTTDIAQLLDLSIKTVESHRENIKHKLHLRSGTQLCKRATKWVERASGLRKSGNLRTQPFLGRKPSAPRESEELQRQQKQCARRVTSAASMRIPQAVCDAPVSPQT